VAYFTEQEIRDVARAAGGGTTYSSQATLNKEAKSWRTSFDIFLSHAFLDAQLILGVKSILESMALTVYVDWIDDPSLDRNAVTSQTAAKLRERMRQAKSLIFATSRASVDSKWMPWELGYFDGIRGGTKIAIFPLVPNRDSSFEGQEYLGLYPRVENLRSVSSFDRQAVVTRGFWRPESKSMHDFVVGANTYSTTAFR
jgi:hypothetical protein